MTSEAIAILRQGTGSGSARRSASTGLMPSDRGTPRRMTSHEIWIITRPVHRTSGSRVV